MLRTILGWLLPVLVRILSWTWRIDQPPWPVSGACVVAFWHGHQLPMIALHRHHGLTGVASLSRDGDFLTGVLQQLGYGVIRGSTSRGGVGVLREALRVLTAGGRVALAVDGPRGPARVVQPGAAILSKKTGLPVVYGVILASGLRLRSWDGFLIPYPFAKVTIRYGIWQEGSGELGAAIGGLEDTLLR